MILGYEEPVQMPTMDIYSTDLMKMYIAAVKDQYDTAREEYKDFLKQYQDFYSLAPGANEEYYNLTIGGAQELMRQLAANGIDPYRSAEGKAAIQNFINSVPRGRVNQLRKEAEAADSYLKSVEKLKAEGKWDPLFDSVLGGGDFQTWDRTKHGPWTRTQAIPKVDIQDITSQFYSKLDKDEDLGPDEALGADAPYYHKYGVRNGTLNLADESSLQAVKDSQYYPLFAHLANNKGYVDADGNPVDTDTAIKMWSREANSQYWSQPETKKYEKAFADLSYQRSRSLARSSGGNSSNQNTELSGYSFIEGMLGESLSNTFAKAGIDEDGTLEGVGNAQAIILENTKTKDSHEKVKQFKTYQDVLPFVKYYGGTANGGMIRLNREAIKSVRLDKELVNNMAGTKAGNAGGGTVMRQALTNSRNDNGTHYVEFEPENAVVGFINKQGIYTMYIPGTVRYMQKVTEKGNEKYVVKQAHVNLPVKQGDFDMNSATFVSNNSYAVGTSGMSTIVGNKNTKIEKQETSK